MRPYVDENGKEVKLPPGVYLYLNRALREKVQEEMKEKGIESPSTLILQVLKERYEVE